MDKQFIEEFNEHDDWRIHTSVNKYYSEEQKLLFRKWMKNILNWEWNEEKQIFYKEPLRNKDGKWELGKVKQPTKRKPNYRDRYSTKQIEEVRVIVKRRKKFLSWDQLSIELEIPRSTLYTMCKNYVK